MQIKRTITSQIIKKLTTSQKAVIIYGPRQVGKTTLCKEVIETLGKKTLIVNADELRYHDILRSQDSKKLGNFVAGYDMLFIDEAQRISDVGITIKILVDSFQKLSLLVTGSSSFELAQKISEPLTGRKWVFSLFPIAQLELKESHNNFELNTQLEDRLIYGAYPEIFSLQGYETIQTYLRLLSSDYLYKDILTLADIRSPDHLQKLVKLLAFQIGSEASLNELGQQLGLATATVARYIDLLEKSFVIFHLQGFSKNLRKEVSKKHKYYFYDLGVRNSVIDNFKPLAQRNDVGGLWENFLVVERMKKNVYLHRSAQSYFWRVYTGGEIDYIEEQSGGDIIAFEFKRKQRPMRIPASWEEAYPHAPLHRIGDENWIDFVT